MEGFLEGDRCHRCKARTREDALLPTNMHNNVKTSLAADKEFYISQINQLMARNFCLEVDSNVFDVNDSSLVLSIYPIICIEHF